MDRPFCFERFRSFGNPCTFPSYPQLRVRLIQGLLTPVPSLMNYLITPYIGNINIQSIFRFPYIIVTNYNNIKNQKSVMSKNKFFDKIK